MKKSIYSASLIGFLSTASLYAVPVFSDDFNSYSDGNLVGQGSWVQTGTNTNSPIQVSSGRITMGQLQDANAPLTSNINSSDGTSFYVGMTLNISSAAAAGDFFLHTTPVSGDSTSFYSRLYARSSGAGFQLGYMETASGTVAYGTTVLDFNTPYQVAVAYDFVAGTLNDTGAIYVNPTSAVRGDNTPYLTDNWTTALAEPTVIGAINLRQAASAAPNLTLDNLVVSADFGDVVVVPEPSTYALMALGAATACWFRRRSK
jgi:hypothetical protein